MAIARKCDRCGKLYEYYPEGNKVRYNGVQRIFNHIGGGYDRDSALDFCSMLNWMQSCGNLGHSSIVGFYSDGDGDFRPKFEFDREYEKTKGYWKKDSKPLPELEVIFDAG